VRGEPTPHPTSPRRQPMPMNEGHKSASSQPSKFSAQSRGDEAQLKSRLAQAQEAAGARAEAGLDISVASPKRAARVEAEAAGAPARGEAELPPKVVPARAEAGRPRERLLDAWHATYSDPLTIALLKSRPPVIESAMEFVSQPDDRQQVTNTTDFPWRCLCF